MRDWTGHLVVLGLGASGEAVAEWGLDRAASGDDVRVSVIDTNSDDRLRSVGACLAARGATVRLGTHELPSDADLIVASPGIRPGSDIMRAASGSGRPVISELELAYRVSGSPWIAITGTNGKTTTTALVGHLLREAGFAAETAGNIGVPALGVARSMGRAGLIVAEVSSFQLTLADRFHPRVAALLNITPDHLDYHGSMEAYSREKAKVFAHQTQADTAVIDIDDPGSAPYADAVEERGVRVVRVSRRHTPEHGAYVRDGVLVLHEHGEEHRLVGIAELMILGDHNVSNALAAAACARGAGAGLDAIRRGLVSFMPIEHRLEPAGVIGGAEYYNDSKATNPDAVLKALTAFGSRPIVLLLGGRNKGVDLRPLAEQASTRTKAVVAFGEAASELEEEFRAAGASVVHATRLDDAVSAARGLATAGDVVLLSPGCTSFDEFSGYEARGRRFKALVAAADSEEDHRGPVA